MADLCKCNFCGEIVTHELEGQGVCSSCGDAYLMDLEGHYVDINELTEDDDLREWCANNRWTKIEVTSIDYESLLVWLADCPYAVDYRDII